jgi:hypothetical protein
VLRVGNTTDRRYILCGTVQVIVAARQMRSIQLSPIGRTCPVTGGIAAQSDPSIRIGVGNRDYHYLSQSEIASDNEDSRSRDTIANEHGLAATCNGSVEAAR